MLKWSQFLKATKRPSRQAATASASKVVWVSSTLNVTLTKHAVVHRIYKIWLLWFFENPWIQSSSSPRGCFKATTAAITQICGEIEILGIPVSWLKGFNFFYCPIFCKSGACFCKTRSAETLGIIPSTIFAAKKLAYINLKIIFSKELCPNHPL